MNIYTLLPIENFQFKLSQKKKKKKKLKQNFSDLYNLIYNKISDFVVWKNELILNLKYVNFIYDQAAFLI